jgi:hypothetical protein
MTRPAVRVRSVLLAAGTVAAASSIACRSQDSTGLGQVPAGALTLSPGGAATTPDGVQIQIAGGASGGEYLFVVADTATASVGSAAFQVAAEGIQPAGSVSAPSTALAPSPATALLGSVGLSGPVLDVGFGARLNERARRRLVRMIPSARTAAASARSGALARRSAQTPSNVQVGDIVVYNVSPNACDSVVDHPARVVAIGSTAIVVADTLDPPGGFTSADYQRFAATFDTLVYPLDVANFGAPTDIDQNGHVVLLFTLAVNQLTARNSESFVGGFFFARDLFPRVGTTMLQGCPGSNEGELFYLLVPDPTGIVNGNRRTPGFVDSMVTGLLAHEFQHLINAGRRIYVNDASDLEVVWLNEGLSHIAEELLFYREGGLAPRSNVDLATLRASTRARAAFNTIQAQNAARYRNYLIAPSVNSPIRDDDSLATRGATWDFLRYSADRKLRGSSGAEAAVWLALVNSTTVGLANLRGVFGADVSGMLRDWSVSHYTDDVVPGVSADFTQPSWNWHDIFPGLGGGGGSYPLLVSPLPAAGTAGTVIPGGAAFYRFAVPANGLASLTLSAGGGVSGRTEGVVVRLR